MLSPSWLAIRLHSRFAEKVASLTMTLSISETVPDRATLDAAHARVVCSNLVAMSVDNAPVGGDVELRADYFPGSSLLQVTVRDSGPGLTAAEARLIFHPFGAPGQGRFGRSGRSLMVARDLARAMGGDLEIRSQAAHGLEFVATFHLGSVVAQESAQMVEAGASGVRAVPAHALAAGGGRERRAQSGGVKGILKSRYAVGGDGGGFGGDLEFDGPLGPVEARLEDGTRPSEAFGGRRLLALVGEDDPLSARMTKVCFALAGMACEIVGDGLAVTSAVAAEPSKFDLIILDDHMARCCYTLAHAYHIASALPHLGRRACSAATCGDRSECCRAQ